MSAPTMVVSEPWLDRKKLAEHYSCSVRSIELALADGMPYAVVFGRVKFQVSAVTPWLVERGYLRIDDGCTVVTGSDANGGGAALTTRPPTTGGKSDGS